MKKICLMSLIGLSMLAGTASAQFERVCPPAGNIKFNEINSGTDMGFNTGPKKGYFGGILYGLNMQTNGTMMAPAKNEVLIQADNSVIVVSNVEKQCVYYLVNSAAVKTEAAKKALIQQILKDEKQGKHPADTRKIVLDTQVLLR